MTIELSGNDRFDRRVLLRRGAILGAGVAGTVVLAGAGYAAQQDASAPEAGAAASPTGSANSQIVAAANAFLATLSDDEKSTVLFDWSEYRAEAALVQLAARRVQARRADVGQPERSAQNAWLAVMQATLSTEGYNRVSPNGTPTTRLRGAGQRQRWRAGLQFGKQYYWSP